ncbi:MAG: tetratricopeptide repeat protein, partial [Gemmataceae bacterium]|nr:tetratricopeptide repeat protein [Gemmataceae bacterium]
INGHADQAEPCFAQAERWDPRTAAWPYLRGMWRASTRPALGRPYFERALPLAKTAAEKVAILYRLAIIQVEAGELDGARQTIDSLATAEPNGPQGKLAAALLAVAENDRATARRLLMDLLDHPCAAVQSHRLLASLLSDDPEQSRRLQEKLERLQIDQPWPDPFLLLMQPYMVNRSGQLQRIAEYGRHGRLAEARAAYQELTAQGPDVDASLAFGNILVDNGQWAEAEEVFRAALAAAPRQVRLHFQLGVLWMTQAEALLAQPSNKKAVEALLGQALAAFDEVIALQKDHADAYVKRARVLIQMERADEAQSAVRQALSLRPEFPEAQWALGELHALRGANAEALRHFEEAVRLAAPDNARQREALERWRRKVKL